jgi:hypothetical protein
MQAAYEGVEATMMAMAGGLRQIITPEIRIHNSQMINWKSSNQITE